MSIETLSHRATESETTYFHSDEIKQRHDFMKYAPGCKDLLDEAMLSEDDKQLLRKVSADFLVASAVRDEDDIAARRTILQYASSDLQDFYGENGAGLRRHVSQEGDVTILIDGRELEEVELSIMYRLIEPSTQVLDAAVAYAAPIEIVKDDIEELEGTPAAEPDEAEEWADLDIFEYDHEPPIEEAHTFRDELRPITGKLIKIGSKVARLSGVRVKHIEQEKIAS